VARAEGQRIMIVVDDIVRLNAPGHRQHGRRHRVLEVSTIDIAARGGVPVVCALCRCLGRLKIGDVLWPLTWLRETPRKPAVQLPLFERSRARRSAA
jgi:hypothetical protein